jgi:hypothetical protein
VVGLGQGMPCPNGVSGDLWWGWDRACPVRTVSGDLWWGWGLCKKPKKAKKQWVEFLVL